MAKPCPHAVFQPGRSPWYRIAGLALTLALAGIALNAAGLDRTAATRASAAGRPAPSTDFTGDGNADLLWRNVATGQIALSPVYGSTVQPAQPLATTLTPDWQVVGSGDCDGDGRADIIAWNPTTGDVRQLLMDGFTVKRDSIIYSEPNTAWRIQAVADFTGDGKADLLWRNAATGDIYLMPLDGSTVLPGQTFYRENRPDWQIVACADFNGDGRADILWWNIRSGEVFLMLMDGPVILAQKTVYQEPDVRWMPVAAGDFAGNGRAGILWRNQATGAVYLMLLDGLSITAQGTLYTEPNPEWQILAVGDYDGDGKADILWQNSRTGQIYQMLMDGLRIRSQGFVYTQSDPAMGAALPAARPTIALFQGSPALLPPGAPCTLTALFAGGQGLITPGNLPILSGQTLIVYPLAGTTYTLTVSAASGVTASYRTTIAIDSTGQRGFAPGPNLPGPTVDHSATLLADGRVLFAGGWSAGSLADASIYDPRLSAGPVFINGAQPETSPAGPGIRPTRPMAVARHGHSATLLTVGPNAGKVLVCGGLDSNLSAIASAELYDPATGTWSFTGSLGSARGWHIAAALGDGRVLVAGGCDLLSTLASAEVYDPFSGTFSRVGSMLSPRFLSAAVTLGSGQVLVIGGAGDGNFTALDTIERFDPRFNLFVSANTMSLPRIAATGILLDDGRVLVSGGITDFPNATSAQEIYDPILGGWTGALAMAVPRVGHTASRLSDGQILLAGGYEATDFPAGSAGPYAEVYDPSRRRLTLTQDLSVPRALHSATVLQDGSVLVAGGNPGWWQWDGSAYLTTEIFH